MSFWRCKNFVCEFKPPSSCFLPIMEFQQELNSCSISAGSCKKQENGRRRNSEGKGEWCHCFLWWNMTKTWLFKQEWCGQCGNGQWTWFKNYWQWDIDQPLQSFQTEKLSRPFLAKDFEGTAGAMEGEGVQRMFRRSEQNFSLSYTGYLGDGNSKIFKKLCDAELPNYPGKKISKLECVGNIQRRRGRKLTNLVMACKSKVYHHNGKKVKGGKNILAKKINLQDSRSLLRSYKESCWWWRRNEESSVGHTSS